MASGLMLAEAAQPLGPALGALATTARGRHAVGGLAVVGCEQAPRRVQAKEAPRLAPPPPRAPMPGGGAGPLP
eukprot:176927-Pyramimonas_sp.AAC.1